MSPTVKNFFRSAVVVALIVAWAGGLAPAAARADSIPRPEGIQTDVNFWIRVYTEVTTNEGFLHDERNLSVIYDTLKFGAGTSSRERQRLVDDRRAAAYRDAAAYRRRAAHRSRTRGTLRGRQAVARDVGPERERDPAAGCHAAHSLPARPVGSLQGRPDSFVELGNPHRRDLRQPGSAAGTRGAAARGVVVQRGRVFEGRRRRPVAVHALDRAALHAHRRCRRRATRSVSIHRGRRAIAGLQLPGARQLAAGTHRL